MIVRRSVCPYDCPDACGLLVEVEDGLAVSVKGDPEHPHSRGSLCPKMTRYPDTVHNPRRLTVPLLRTGPKGSGAFAPIPWTEAIDRIASAWKAIIADHGAQAILPYSYAGTMGLVQRNAGHPFFHRLGASRLDRTICTPAKAAGLEAVLGQTPCPRPSELRDCDLVILWGINAVATSVHGLKDVREARRRGGRVWLVDTYRTPTAGEADSTFLVRPGSDGALALGIMHVLVRDGLQDRAFLAEHVQGFPELAREVLPDYPPARVEALTGLPAAEIEAMARAYGTAKAPCIVIGGGLSRYGNGAMTVRTIACLPALVGAYDRPGGGCFGSTSTGGAFAMAEITREDLLPGPVRTVNMNRLGHALGELDGPRVMSLYVYHSNPAVVAPDQNAVLAGLAREDLFTVVHERFLTDTARYADIVLPATSSLEHSDLYRSYGSYCVQRARPAVPPVGESRSNWDVFGLLAGAMGFPEPFFRQSADDLIEHLLALPSPWREGVDASALAEGRAVEVAPPPGPRFRTPSGKVELLNPREPHPLPRFLPTHAGGEAPPFALMTAPSLFGLNSSFCERDELRARRKGMRIRMNPGDAAARGLADGDPVEAFNGLGEVAFALEVSSDVPAGVLVAEGVWWLEFAPGTRTVNALTSQRLTDRGGGSTFYDNRVDIRLRSPRP
ncbi:molybdopterin-containing oxidoreductase family protein [Mesoterricola silvestris]|nr:molybdopterin oxidoreductase family protein [Mesoterricola silvestris]